MAKTFYNENDPKAAAWLRELIRHGHISDGVVDTRSITEIKPADLAGYTRAHFFAGIGGWDAALQLAGWGDATVWTGSCPCQPFSCSGQQRGTDDERHLWPVFFKLIEACRPPVVFGEQVASADVLGKMSRKPRKKAGKVWLDGVFDDLEAAHYACWAEDIPAASLGAPHVRQRVYWVAHLQQPGLEGHTGDGDNGNEPGRNGAHAVGPTAASCGAGGLGDAEANGREVRPQLHGELRGEITSDGCKPVGLGNPTLRGRGIVWHAAQPGSGGHLISPEWSRFDIVHCRDGKARRFEPGSFPLAHGVSNRVVKLRGFGNAIVPALSAEFVAAFQETVATTHNQTV